MDRPPPNREQGQSRDERIAERVRAIPEGFVRTYGDIDPRAPRQVGLVLSRTHGIPWHRVVRAAGLSANKLASLRDLSAKVLDGTVVLSRTSRRSDDELIAALVTVRGIGRWTAQMYLMFQLRRLDVWPVEDLGIRQGYGLAWNLDPPPSAKELAPLGDRFRPYRSVVARYCWAAVPLFRRG